MSKRTSLLWVAQVAVVIGSLSADDIVDLDPVLAIGQPIIELSQISATGKVDVISESILDALNAGDLTDALRRVPGVTVSRYNPVGAFGGSDGGGVFIRGHGSGRPGADIATMIDGIPLFVGVWTHPLIDTLSVDMAGSIEVMKSPQPVLMGSMGFGAINIIPKTAILEDHHGEIEGSYGHYDTSLIRGEYAYLGEHMGMVVSGSHRKSDGHRDNADGEVDAFYGNFAYSWTDQWSTSLLVSVTDSWAHDPEPVEVILPITERYQTRNRFYLAKTSYDGSRYDFEIKLHVENGEGSWLQWHQAPPPPFPSQSLHTLTSYENEGMKSKFSGNWGESGEWAMGLSWDRFGGKVTESYDLGVTNVFDNVQFEILSPWVQFDHTIELSGEGRALELNAGARYMSHSVFDAKWVAQMGAIFKTPYVHTYINYADTVNYPGVFVSVFGRRGPPWNVGDDWRELDAETIRHYEIGTKVLLNRVMTLDLSLFRDEVGNAIRLVTPPPSGYILNLGEYTTQGAELLMHYHTNFWSAFAGFTWLDSDQDTPNSPKWSGTIGFHVRKGRWSLAADFQKVAAQYTFNPRFEGNKTQIEGYQLLNARISYRLESDMHAWEWYLHGENLANQPYEYRPGYPMPGVNLTTGLKWEW